jgi:hypothetical protein
VHSFLANYLEPICYLIYTAVLFDRYRHNRAPKYGILLGYYLCTFGLLLLSSILAMNGMDNNWTYNSFFFLTILFLSWYFYLILVRRFEKILVLSLLAVNVFLFLKFVVLKDKFFGTYNSEVFGFSLLTIVIHALFYVNQLLREVEEGNLLLNLDFWLVASYLIYFLGGFFVVLFYYHSSISERATVWSLLNIVLLVSAIIALVGNQVIRKHEKRLKCQT